MSGYTKGIDVSEHNGVIDWDQVKSSGITFAMLRAGYGRTVDKQFRRNAAECNRLGILIGVYWFSYALNAAGAAQEAAACLTAIEPYQLNLPVAFDLEYDSVSYAQKQGVQIGKELASAMARSFCDAIRTAGYSAANYANPDYLNRYFDSSVRDGFPIWLAQWPNGTPNLDKPPRACAIWQYSERGSVPGISGAVDLDVCYVDYSKKEEDTMTGEQIYDALNAHLDTLPVPDWAKKELDEAKEMGITDGKNPMRLIPRYQAAIMAKRAVAAVAEQTGK